MGDDFRLPHYRMNEWPTEIEDLHRNGDDDCDHEFRGWETTSGSAQYVTYADDVEQRTVAGWFRFENKCRRCDARIGRRVSTEVPQ